MRKIKDHTCAGPVKLSSSSIGVRLRSFRYNTGRLMSSSRAVSEPDMPMADRAYSRRPRNGVATPQYFMESHEREIW